ncbi:LacI family DNA-binding transcriptional regulator [Castellaniella sp.]|uniref:LacI family DNA-binding transcriptional regulator n=1 Tax=Castellaniella sp. TaxID=1955812 RepID=UPI002B00026B|nr:LacI family DNA-binding transcriptional regulator [Castellaniella sp.]
MADIIRKNTAPRATIADVARHAGVSKATVSRFLNHRDTLLSPEISDRVAAAVEALSYTPSPMAQALKRGRSRLVGLVVADITNPYSVAVLSGAEQACRQAGFLMMLFNLGNDRERESVGLRILSSYQVEGFILNTMGLEQEAVVTQALQGRPVVLVDRLRQGMDVDFVSLDNQQAIGMCIRHLQQAGYGEFLLVTEPLDGISSRMERVAAFEALQGPVSGQWLEARPDDHAGLVDALRALRRRARHTPALIAGNAVVTMRIVAAVAELGWQLGRDIGLVGIDDTLWAPYVGPGISAVAQPTDALGNLAAQCLIERMAGLDAPARAIRLPGSLVVRGSTRLG